MNNSRISLIFNTFSKKEIREFRKWLLSPAHNQRQDVRDLFEFLIKNIENGKIEHITKEVAAKKIFPKEPYDDAKLRQTIHFLYKATEEFLIYNELTADEVSSRRALASIFRKRNIDKLFNKAIKDAKDLQVKSKFRNSDFQQNEFEIELEEYSFREKKKRTAEMNLQELHKALDLTFMAKKLQYSYLMYAHQTVYKAEYDFGILDSMLAYIEETGLHEVPAVGVYYHGLKTHFEKDNAVHFQNLKDTIFTNQKLFPSEELRDIYLMAMNYLISQMNSGDPTIREQLFEFYRKGIEDKILMEQEILSRVTFRNAVSLALMQKEYDWVEAFIPNYSKYLQDKHRESIVDYSRARLNFDKKDYTRAMQLLTQVEFDDILMNLNAKSMLVRMYYEEDEFDALESLLGSMRAYLTRKKVMGYHKSNFSNLIKFTKKLLKVSPYEKTQIERLRMDIQEANPMATTERNWLLEQLDRL